MNIILYYLIVYGLTASLGRNGAVVAVSTYDLLKAPNYFDDFIHRYGKNYTSELERLRRFKIFQHNLNDIIQKNRHDMAQFEINKFADMSTDETIAKYTGLSFGGLPPENFCKIILLDQPPGRGPLEFDWRRLNKVTSVKDQGLCGACWAFATLASLESQVAIKHDRLINLSEQQVVDCDLINHGCDGGLLHTAFETIIELGGVQLEEDYPYVANSADYCRMNVDKFEVRIKDCYRYVTLNEEKLKDLLRVAGPIPMAIDAADILNYKRGVIKFCTDNGLNHAVLLVGYGVDDGVPYWTFKNTWGTDWGESGYFRLQQNVNACGMKNDLASTATIY